MLPAPLSPSGEGVGAPAWQAATPTTETRDVVNAIWIRRIVIAATLVVVAVLLVYINDNAVTGDQNTSLSRPAYVDRLIPASGDSVLVQDQVGIDLAVGYDAYLNINGVDIRNTVDDPTEDGLLKTLSVGMILYTPREGHVVPKLESGENCVTAFIWKQEDGSDSAKPLRWCFTET